MRTKVLAKMAPHVCRVIGFRKNLGIPEMRTEVAAQVRADVCTAVSKDTGRAPEQAAQVRAKMPAEVHLVSVERARCP